MPLLQSTTLLASPWPCHQCSHSNDLSRNKKRCSSCWAWRDGLAPLSAKGSGTLTPGAAASNVGLVDDDATCHDKNGPPNNASPCRDGSPTKSRGGTKRKSPSRGLGSPANATQRQMSLLEMLAWFSKWKELHDKRVKEEHATKYIFLQMKLGSASNHCCWDTSRSCTSTV